MLRDGVGMLVYR